MARHTAANREFYKEALEKKFDELTSLIKSAVPNGDIEGHRKAHESLIKTATRWEDFQFKLFTGIVEKGGWAVVLGVAYAVWSWIKEQVHK